ncbi:MAG: hypothetical protein II453_02145 [Alphaproteobacteria bacterium]|nr:hypothetical protein [Alphaproteobacteria bacterium]
MGIIKKSKQDRNRGIVEMYIARCKEVSSAVAVEEAANTFGVSRTLVYNILRRTEL